MINALLSFDRRPVDRLLRLLHDSACADDLRLPRKNADRLLRVINQLLDFRKLDTQQEQSESFFLKLTIRGALLISLFC